MQRAERDGIRTAVDHVGAAHGQEFSLRIQREFRIGGQIARLIVAEERLAAFAGPFHRATDAPSGPGHQREFRIGRATCAEIATDIVHNHAHVIVRDTKHNGRVVTRAHRAAGAGVQRVAPGRRIIFADRGAWLHRHTGDALHRGAEAHDMRSGCERCVGRARVAHLGIEAEIRCGVRPRVRSIRRHCLS